MFYSILKTQQTMSLKVIIAFVLTISVTTLKAQKEIDFFGNLKIGLHKVGTKQIMLIDSLEKIPREIAIRLWYPARGNGEKMKFSDYLDPKNKSDESELLQDISTAIGGAENLFSKDSLELMLNSNMKALKDAEAKIGRFPLLIWSIRYGTVKYQNIISEYLASHGYVVAFAEEIPNSPFPWQLQSNAKKINAINQQIIDINASIEYLKHLQNIDQTKIGLLSWSYAGESAILTQMDNLEIDLVVGLSSIGFASGIYLGAGLNEKIDFEKINVPYLMLFEKVAPNGNTRTPPDSFNSMHSNSRYVSFKELAHGSFNGLEGMIPGILKSNKVQPWSKGGEVAQIGYEVICKITLSFLNAVFHETNLESFDTRTSLLKEELPLEFISIESPKRE